MLAGHAGQDLAEPAEVGGLQLDAALGAQPGPAHRRVAQQQRTPAAGRRRCAARTGSAGRSSAAGSRRSRPRRRAARTTTTSICRATCSTSSRMCELNSTVRPSAPIVRSRSIRWIRWRGSMPLNGSSSSSTDGWCTSDDAILIRCRMPLEYVEIDAVLRVGHLHQRDRRLGGRAGVGQPVQLGVGDHELAAGEVLEQRLALGDQADLAVDLLVAPQRLAVEGDRAGRRREEARHHRDQGGLAGAVGAEQAGDAGADGHRDVVDGDDVAVPPARRGRAGACSCCAHPPLTPRPCGSAAASAPIAPRIVTAVATR